MQSDSQSLLGPYRGEAVCLAEAENLPFSGGSPSGGRPRGFLCFSSGELAVPLPVPTVYRDVGAGV